MPYTSMLFWILFCSVALFVINIVLRKNKAVSYEIFVILGNLSFLVGASMIVNLMIARVFLIEDLEINQFVTLGTLTALFLLNMDNMFREIDALKCMIMLDPFTKEVRVLFKGLNFVLFYMSEQKILDMKAEIASNIEEDFPTATPGTMYKVKVSVISRPYFGGDTDPIEVRAQKAMDFVKFEKALKLEQEVFAKKLLQDFFKSHTIADCRKAKSSHIFPDKCFEPLEKKFPIKFSEPSVYDVQPDEKTMAQERELRDAENFKSIISILMSGENGLSKQDAVTMAPFLAKIDWKKSIDENNYNINFSGLPENLGDILTPEALAAITVAFGKSKSSKKTK